MKKDTQEDKKKYIPKIADLTISDPQKNSIEQPPKGRVPKLQHIKPKTFPEILAESRP